MEDTTLIRQNSQPILYILNMKYLKFILESNSNKQLELMSKEIIKVARQTATVKAGPIPSKGKRIIFLYNPSITLLNRLFVVKVSKKVSTTITELDTSFNEQFYLDWS